MREYHIKQSLFKLELVPPINRRSSNIHSPFLLQSISQSVTQDHCRSGCSVNPILSSVNAALMMVHGRVLRTAMGHDRGLSRD